MLATTADAKNQQAAPACCSKPITPELLLANNKEWAAEMTRTRPDFFASLADQQHPEVLWFGCSDSRVPANQLLKLDPGEVFVHRNVAAIIHGNDLNAHVVLQYAVEVLKVKHVVVCGHYGCGGVAAALSDSQFGLIDYWIRVVKDLYVQHEAELAGLNQQEKCDRMVELNVHASVKAIANTPVVQNAWAKGQELAIYGWCYRLTDGILQDLDIKIDSVAGVAKAHRVKPISPKQA
ncbi:hypothetical protein HDU86_002779 [Geranomyces michiganensis]|nr:hypothetical protein HDU86_002779 [Geranomyces michiganensis]